MMLFCVSWIFIAGEHISIKCKRDGSNKSSAQVSRWQGLTRDFYDALGFKKNKQTLNSVIVSHLTDREQCSPTGHKACCRTRLGESETDCYRHNAYPNEKRDCNHPGWKSALGTREQKLDENCIGTQLKDLQLVKNSSVWKIMRAPQRRGKKGSQGEQNSL